MAERGSEDPLDCRFAVRGNNRVIPEPRVCGVNHHLNRRVAVRGSDRAMFSSQGCKFQEANPEAFIRDENHGKKEYPGGCSVIYPSPPCFDNYVDEEVSKEDYLWVRKALIGAASSKAEPFQGMDEDEDIVTRDIVSHPNKHLAKTTIEFISGSSNKYKDVLSHAYNWFIILTVDGGMEVRVLWERIHVGSVKDEVNLRIGSVREELIYGKPSTFICDKFALGSKSGLTGGFLITRGTPVAANDVATAGVESLKSPPIVKESRWDKEKFNRTLKFEFRVVRKGDKYQGPHVDMLEYDDGIRMHYPRGLSNSHIQSVDIGVQIQSHGLNVLKDMKIDNGPKTLKNGHGFDNGGGNTQLIISLSPKSYSQAQTQFGSLQVDLSEDVICWANGVNALNFDKGYGVMGLIWKLEQSELDWDKLTNGIVGTGRLEWNKSTFKLVIIAVNMKDGQVLPYDPGGFGPKTKLEVEFF